MIRSQQSLNASQSWWLRCVPCNQCLHGATIPVPFEQGRIAQSVQEILQALRNFQSTDVAKATSQRSTLESWAAVADFNGNGRFM